MINLFLYPTYFIHKQSFFFRLLRQRLCTHAFILIMTLITYSRSLFRMKAHSYMNNISLIREQTCLRAFKEWLGRRWRRGGGRECAHPPSFSYKRLAAFEEQAQRPARATAEAVARISSVPRGNARALAHALLLLLISGFLPWARAVVTSRLLLWESCSNERHHL